MKNRKTLFFKSPSLILAKVSLFCMAVVLITRFFGGAWICQPAFAGKDSRPEKWDRLVKGMKPIEKPGASLEPGSKPYPRFSLHPDGTLRNLGAPPFHFFSGESIVPDRPGETARNFLKENAILFGAQNPKLDFKSVKSVKRQGRHFERFQQTYEDLPVFGAQAIVQINDSGGIEYVVSDILREGQIQGNLIPPVVPGFSDLKALVKGRGLLKKKYGSLVLTATPFKLMIFVPGVIGSDGPARLVWHFKLFSEENGLLGEQLLIDAHNGQVIRRYPLIRSALNREIFDADNTTDDPGTLIRTENDSPSGITDVDDVYDFLGDTYDFYLSYHGRDGIDNPSTGAALDISATVRLCSDNTDTCSACPCRNAYWSGSLKRFYFGENFGVDDVVAHEYTHGVTDHESDLVYENESGAINESLSDIWGEFVDLTNGAGTDTPDVRWLIGEDLPHSSSETGALRDMSDPPQFNDPDRMGSDHYYKGTADNGGVHTNSGVNNKLCYLLTDGDTFNNQTVNGQGIRRVAELYYEVQANLLPSGADHTDLYNALVTAAINLGWTSSQRNDVYRSCVAVEIAEAEKNVYVDKAFVGFPELGLLLFPYKTVNNGNNALNPGDTLMIKGGSYDETIRFDKVMKIRGREGVVTIGK